VLYKNSLQCFTHTVRHFGPAAVFRGTLITAIRDVNYGQWFAQYEWTKRWLMSQHEEGESKMFPICEIPSSSPSLPRNTHCVVGCAICYARLQN